MAQHHIDTLKKIRTKMVEQRRAMALRHSAPGHMESAEHIVALQNAIEATDRAIADEEDDLRLTSEIENSQR
jgi:hypothetical protein